MAFYQTANRVVAAHVADVRPLVRKQEETAKRLKAGFAALDEIQAERCRESFVAYVNQTNPFVLEPWQEIICERLQRLRFEKGQRIAIHAPPQLGKSIIVSQRWPSWMLGHQPTNRIRLVCFNQTHAEKFSEVNQELLRQPEFLTIFPDADCRIPNKCKVHEWSTVGRKRLLDGQKSFAALGLGSGFTGSGVDTLIIDDPYKSQAEAYSEVINTSIWDWWRMTARSRLNPETNIVVMFHRWKEDDLAGQLIAEGGWEQFRFPAIADGGAFDPSGRQEGTTLSPRYPIEYYRDIESKDPFTFLCLYQGTPIAPGGLLCKEAWLRLEPDAPRKMVAYVRYWDKAGTEGGGKYTAGVLIGRDADGLFWVLDVVRGQWGSIERERMIRNTAVLDAQQYGWVTVWVEEEPGSGGKESAENTIRSLAGYEVYSEKVGKEQGSKVARFTPFCSQARAGNVRVLARPWTKDYINELIKFPAGSFSDQVDGSSGALNKLSAVIQWKAS